MPANKSSIVLACRLSYAQARKPPPMRMSREVQLTLLAAVALSLTGCRDQHADCVDPQNHKVPDSVCRLGTPGAHYIYGGASGGHIGDAVVGGSVTRGGFGGFGSGGDAGGE
jgi:hypothetical protein